MNTSIWDRLERMLHRESHAVRIGHRDLLALPVDERVDSGDCLAGLAWVGEDAGGTLRVRAPENHAKFRRGDRLRLGNEDDGKLGAPVEYVSWNLRSGIVTLLRDGAFREPGEFDPRRPLQLDPEATVLTDPALQALARVRRGGPAREVLDLTAEARVDDAARRRALERCEREDALRGLDASQREAFASALSTAPVALVQGPPGTGKTRVLAHVVAALAQAGERVLVTAYTHRAVNHALAGVARLDAGLDVVKIGADSSREGLEDVAVGGVRSFRRLPPERGRPRIVGASVFAIRSAWDREPFDVVVFDEAAQVPLAYAPIAMVAGARFVLVGDHRQLGPIVQGRHRDALAPRSLFEHLAERYPPVLLRTTYRMNDGIAAFPSAAFYGGLLSPSAEAAGREFPAVPGGPFDAVFDPGAPAVIATVDHEGFRSRAAPEADAVADLVADLLARQRVAPAGVAVVCPYRAQIRAIYTKLRERMDGAGVSDVPVVDTVERIQGQEREVVVVSLTASDPDWLAGPQAEFFFSPNRLNVTLTRARTKLVVVASRHLFRALPRDLDGLLRADLFRRLWRALPHVDLSERYLPGAAERR